MRNPCIYIHAVVIPRSIDYSNDVLLVPYIFTKLYNYIRQLALQEPAAGRPDHALLSSQMCSPFGRMIRVKSSSSLLMIIIEESQD